MTQTTETKTAAEALLDAALMRVESPSIKEWVQSQREVWLQHAVTPLVTNPRPDNLDRLLLQILCEAIGL